MFEPTDQKITVPANLRYNDSHVWMEYSEPGLIKCGITGYLCGKSGEIVSVDFSRNIQNMDIDFGDPIVTIESLNDSIVIYSPLPGIVTEINKNCVDMPEIINSEPFGDGWLFIISSDNVYDFEDYMRHDEYEYLILKEKEDIDSL